jgi:hypothetical protein
MHDFGIGWSEHRQIAGKEKRKSASLNICPPFVGKNKIGRHGFFGDRNFWGSVVR